VADVAVISVITTGVVGVAGIAGTVYTARLTRKGAREERLEARRDDLRSVLDEAAKAATKMHQPNPVAVGPYTFGDFAKYARELHGEVREQLARLGVRTGPGATVYREYVRIAAEMNTVRQVAAEMPSDMPMTGVRRQVGEQGYRLRVAVKEIDDADERFLAAAVEEVGVGDHRRRRRWWGTRGSRRRKLAHSALKQPPSPSADDSDEPRT
jgi:hypothetical protein